MNFYMRTKLFKKSIVLLVYFTVSWVTSTYSVLSWRAKNSSSFFFDTFNISGIISGLLVDKARSLFKRTRAWRAASSFVAEDIGQMGLFRGQSGYLGQSSSSHPTKSLSSRPPTRRPLPLAPSISIMSENLSAPRLFGLL